MNRFEDIRPYYEEEIPAAIQRISSSEFFPLLASFVFPDQPLDATRESFRKIKTTREFQLSTMKNANTQIIKRSIDHFSCTGLSKLDAQSSYLYVSNHRDIMLDSSLFQYALVLHGFDTTEITFGANLMMNELITDIGKSNKMFRVERPGGSIKEFYQKSLHLSEYIHYTITQKKQSVWIAQRNGRTKDGNDATDQGIIKMFGMANSSDKIQALDELCIVPLSISYEWEPCDILKTLELYQSQFTKYIKKPGEDLNSILTGIMQPKGEVHIEVCNRITREELLPLLNLKSSEYHKAVAHLIDLRINSAYKLYANNYIAHDVLYGNDEYSNFYSAQQKEKFMKRLSEIEQFDTCDIERLKEIFLSIYSNPIDKKKSLT